ncbi:glutamine amidotransferase-related protein [Marisediminicola sp. LYQ134]|uniref:glutamine amidotransferase-related protein n=1 Tax=Marisediminicola sp. LYQ134 TaxID=3391061 RepID=UPI003983A9A4
MTTSLRDGKAALVVHHSPNVDLGSLDEPLLERGWTIETVDARELTASAVGAADLVVVLGGTMGAYEVDEHPFLAGELEALRDRLQSEKPTFGICLGAQLMAEALGSRASKGKATVIGFRDVQLTDAGRDSPLRHFDGVPVMQWHGDSFRLPAGATRLASSADYSNEGYRMGDFALAVQFHPEVTDDMLEHWIASSGAELAAEEIDPADIREQCVRLGAQMTDAGRAMFGEWLDRL